MKALLYVLIFILLAQPSDGGDLSLSLRMGEHKDFLRFVIEGEGDILERAIVNQRREEVMITFPVKGLRIRAEGDRIRYKVIDENAILLSPGNPQRIKVSRLDNPSRLVIDVYPEETRKDEKTARASSLKAIIIDPGHGGYDTGIVKGGYTEKTLTLDIAKRLSSIISRSRAKAILTREADLYMSLNERISLANNKGADLFISLHIGDHKEVIIYTPLLTETPADYIKRYLVNKGQAPYLEDSSRLGKVLKDAFVSGFGKEEVLIRPLPYTMLSMIEAPAVIIELPSPEGGSYTEEFKSLIVNIIYKGISGYEAG